MKAKKYANGGPVDPDKKKKVAAAKGKTSAAYEARRAESRKQSEENANLTRRQMEINKRTRMEQNPEAYSKARATTPQYKQVSGRAQGISTAEVKGASKGTVGAMTPEAAKRSEAAMKNRPTAPAAKAPVAPARKPGELSPETKAAIEKGKARSVELGKKAADFTMEEARRKGMQLKGGGSLAKLLKRK
jgi:hypothetical protein